MAPALSGIFAGRLIVLLSSHHSAKDVAVLLERNVVNVLFVAMTLPI